MNATRNALVGIFALFLFVASAAPSLGQGSLDPASAPAPTMKTLAQVEARTPITNLPYNITQSGSYYLTGDLTCSGSSTGIVVSAASVVLDLNGFTLVGPGAGSGSAIYAQSANKSLKIFNGRIYNWLGAGKYALYSLSQASLLRDLVVEECGFGFYVAKAQVQNCVIHSCTRSDSGSFFGISGSEVVVENCIVHSCEALDGAAYGISIALASIARNCSVYNLTGSTAAYGFQAQSGSIIENCMARSCDYGISAHNQAVIRNSVFSNNRSYGIYAFTAGSRIEGNHLIGNNYGIYSAQNATNLFIANSACMNSNAAYHIVRGNLGPIQEILTNTTAVVTNHPWANFAY